MIKLDFTTLTNTLLDCPDVGSVTYSHDGDLYDDGGLCIRVLGVDGFVYKYTMSQEEITKARHPSQLATNLADLIMNEIRQ